MGAGSNADAIRGALRSPDGLDTRGGHSNYTIDGALIGWWDELSKRRGGFIFDRWRNHPAARKGWREEAWGTGEDERILNELRDLEFWRLDACVIRLNSLAAAGEAMKRGAAGMHARLQDAWRGKAADAALAKFDQLAKSSQAYHDSLARIAAALDAAGGVGRDGLSRWVTEMRNGTSVSDLFVDGAGEADGVAFRSTQIDRIDEALRGGSRFGRPHTVDELKVPGNVDLNTGGGPFSDYWWSNDTINYLDGYCARYDAIVGKFRRIMREVHGATRQAWTTLQDTLKQVEAGGADPFGPLTMPGATGEATPSQQPVPQERPPRSTGQPPGDTDLAGRSADIGSGRTSPSYADPGRTDPSLAGPGHVDPGADPRERAQAGLVPGMVGPGAAGSPPGQGIARPDQSEKVTIKDGDRTISVGRPDASGRYQVTMDDGTGEPTVHEFGGENGPAVIRDGDTTLTAQPLPPDGLRLTVDDGTGPPTTYNVDFAADTGGAQQPGPQPSQPGTPGVPGPPPDGAGAGGGAASGFGGSAGGGSGGGGGGSGGAETGGAGAPGPQQPREPAVATGAQSPDPPEHRTAAASVGSDGPAGPRGAPMGGMPMGAMGAGGGQGGDQQRGGSKWRTQGNLFDDNDPAVSFGGIVGEDPASRARRSQG